MTTQTSPRRASARSDFRDFDQPVVLYAVASDEAALAQPVAVRVVPAEGHNLVAPATTFVGREDALAELTSRVAPGRLLTIVGPGGMGKTRLAVELGLRVADAWSDGVWIADLSKATNGRLVAAAVADSLGVPGGERDDRSSILDHLESRSALLILDSCEHVPLAAARLASDILNAHPSIAILATSRQPLALPVEEVLAHRLASDGRRLGEAVRRPRPLSRPRLLALCRGRAGDR